MVHLNHEHSFRNVELMHASNDVTVPAQEPTLRGVTITIYLYRDPILFIYWSYLLPEWVFTSKNSETRNLEMTMCFVHAKFLFYGFVYKLYIIKKIRILYRITISAII